LTVQAIAQDLDLSQRSAPATFTIPPAKSIIR
jgi:hypothetical protein